MKLAFVFRDTSSLMDSEQLIKEGFQNYSLSLSLAWVCTLGVGHYFRTHRERAKLRELHPSPRLSKNRVDNLKTRTVSSQKGLWMPQEKKTGFASHQCDRG